MAEDWRQLTADTAVYVAGGARGTLPASLAALPAADRRRLLKAAGTAMGAARDAGRRIERHRRR